MKKMRTLINVLTASGIALAMVATVAAQNPLQGSATVVRMKGHARYTTGTGDWKPLNLGDVLKPGAIIQTDMGKGSYVDVVLSEGGAAVPVPVATGAAAVSGGPTYKLAADQNVVRVAENTVLGVDKLTAMQTGADLVTETQLDLKSGHIFGSVKKMSAASRYEIKLPNGVAGIRGTTYELWANGSGKVSGGSMVLSLVGPGGQPETKVLSGGQAYDSQSKQVAPLPDADKQSLDGMEGALHAALGGEGAAAVSRIGGLNQAPLTGVPRTPVGDNSAPLMLTPGEQHIPFSPDRTFGRGTTNRPPHPPHP